MRRKLPSRKDNYDRINKKMADAAESGAFQNFCPLVNMAYDLLLPNRETWQYFDYEPDQWLEISCDTVPMRGDIVIVPHIHFLITTQYLYLNGSIFPFVGHDYPQSSDMYSMVLHHYIEMLFMFTHHYSKLKDLKIRGVKDKYREFSDETKIAYKKNAKAIGEYVRGYVDSIEESEYFNPEFTLPIPVVDEDILSMATGKEYPIRTYHNGRAMSKIKAAMKSRQKSLID